MIKAHRCMYIAKQAGLVLDLRDIQVDEYTEECRRLSEPAIVTFCDRFGEVWGSTDQFWLTASAADRLDRPLAPCYCIPNFYQDFDLWWRLIYWCLHQTYFPDLSAWMRDNLVDLHTAPLSVAIGLSLNQVYELLGGDPASHLP